MRSNYVARTRSVDFYDIGLVNTTDKKLSYRKQVAHQHHARDKNAITQYIHCKIIPSSRHGTVRDRQTDRQTGRQTDRHATHSEDFGCRC